MACHIQIGDDPTIWWLAEQIQPSQLTQPLGVLSWYPIRGNLVLSPKAAHVAIFTPPPVLVPTPLSGPGGLYLPTATGPSAGTLSLPSTLARSAAGLTRDGSARPPNSRPSPETTMVLPAPVSPVTTLKPLDSSSTASSITPSPVIRTSSSIAARLLVSLARRCCVGAAAMLF